MGLRNWRNVSGQTLGRYKISLSFGNLQLQSGLSSKSYGGCVNFLDPFKSGYVELPEQLEYWPAIFVKHIDCASKSETIIGTATIANTGQYVDERCVPISSRAIVLHIESENADDPDERQPLLNDTLQKTIATNRLAKLVTTIVRSKIRRFKKPELSEKTTTINTASRSNFTWWTKYYNSLRHSSDYDCTQKHRLRIFDAELESRPEFGCLRDWADCLDLIKHSERPPRKSVQRKAYARMKIDVKVLRFPETYQCYSLNKYWHIFSIVFGACLLVFNRLLGLNNSWI